MPEISKKIFSWYTTYVFITFILMIMFKNRVNVYTKKMIICVTLSCAILGFFIVRRYYDNIPDKYRWIINLGDIFCHILPTIYILFMMKKKSVKNNLDMFILPILFSLPYLYFYKPSKVYWITGWTDQQLIISLYLIYVSVLMLY